MAYEYLEINGVKVPLPLSAFPVGAIYMSINDTNPASFLGGTWERIKDRFLLSAGDSYDAGSEGGSADAVVVSHEHGIATRYYATTGGSDVTGAIIGQISQGDRYWEDSISTEGESGIGKNMPPYLAVYMWKRIA